MAMPTPTQQAAAQPKVTVQPVLNQLNNVVELMVTITNDGNAAQSNLLIFPGPCPTKLNTVGGYTKPDGVHATLSASVSGSYAEFVAWLASNKFAYKYIRMQTTDTNIY